tara:strand:- start:3079 stop:3501 length:423 start_codon:yes stop_codon:yes gene_type:complete
MAKIYDSTSEISIAQDLAAGNVVYKSFARATKELSSVQSSTITFEVLMPFSEGLIRRVVLCKQDEQNLAQVANLILTENQILNKIDKILEYNSINFSESYLDSEEEIYYSSIENKVYAHVNVDGNFSTNLLLRLDIEKVN